MRRIVVTILASLTSVGLAAQQGSIGPDGAVGPLEERLALLTLVEN